MKKLLLLLILLNSSLTLVAEEFKELVSSIPLTTLPSGHLLIKVNLNGRDTSFILDSGATGSVVDIAFAEQLQLKKAEDVIIGQAASEENIRTAIVEGVTLLVGGKNAQLKQVFSQNLSILSQLHKEPIYGILGQDAIVNLAGIIDLKYKQFLIPLKKNDRTLLSKLEKMPTLKLQADPSGLYLIDAEIGRRSVKLILDTGAPQIVLTKSFAERNFPSHLSELKHQYSLGANGEKNKIYQLSDTEIMIGNQSFGKAHVVDNLDHVLNQLVMDKKRPIIGVIGLADFNKLEAFVDLSKLAIYYGK